MGCQDCFSLHSDDTFCFLSNSISIQMSQALPHLKPELRVGSSKRQASGWPYERVVSRQGGRVGVAQETRNKVFLSSPIAVPVLSVVSRGKYSHPRIVEMTNYSVGKVARNQSLFFFEEIKFNLLRFNVWIEIPITNHTHITKVTVVIFTF